MKKKTLLMIVVALIAVMTFALTACGGPKNIEEYLSGTDILEEIAGDEEGLTITAKENDVIFDYDMSTVLPEGTNYDKDKLIEGLEEGLETNATTFEAQCKTLEDESGLSGVHLVVNYNLNGELLASRSYTSGAE